METVQITINSGNALTPYEVYAVKTKKRELVIGYYNEDKNVFKSDTIRILHLMIQLHMQVWKSCKIK